MVNSLHRSKSSLSLRGQSYCELEQSCELTERKREKGLITQLYTFISIRFTAQPFIQLFDICVPSVQYSVSIQFYWDLITGEMKEEVLK